MPDLNFKVTSVDEIPTRKYWKKVLRKYAPIIDAFLESEHKLVKVEDTGKEANSLCVQLKKLCRERGLDSVTLTVRNKEVYLEKD